MRDYHISTQVLWNFNTTDSIRPNVNPDGHGRFKILVFYTKLLTVKQQKCLIRGGGGGTRWTRLVLWSFGTWLQH